AQVTDETLEELPQPDDPFRNPIPGPSSHHADELIRDEANLSFSVTPQDCHLLPKIRGKRNTTQRKSYGSSVLTITPYKDALEDNIKMKETKGKKKRAIQVAKTTVKARKQSISSSSDTEDDDQNTICLYCSEEYSRFAGEGWIQCSTCSKWALDKCAGVDEEDSTFVCDICSDSPL
uniref:PHD finger protein ALFIN-LIKE 7-like n=1 Tax=Diabrotica virgifera virgifera TaxID=50390 RepID=A0A6P7HCS6_DIAVI